MEDEKANETDQLQAVPAGSLSTNEVRPLQSLQYIAGLSANLGSFGMGLAYAWTSSAGDNGAHLRYHFEVNSNDFSWISSIYNIGAALMSIPIGVLANLIGRRGALLALAIPSIIGWACVIWPNSMTTLIFGRFLLGLSGGGIGVAAPMYTAEIADKETRGRIGCYFEFLFTLGTLSAYILALLHNIFLQSLISATVPFIFVVIFFYMPETPTYYLRIGNVQAARDVLIRLRGVHYDFESELAEHRRIQDEADRNSVSFFVAIRSRAAVRGLIIGYGLVLFKTCSGIDVSIIYASNILRDAAGSNVIVSMIIMGVIQVTAAFLFTLVVDKWGRRIPLLTSGAFIGLASFVLGIYFYLQKNGASMDNFSWIRLVCVCGISVSYFLGYGPVTWMMLGELFSPQIKGVAGSSACFFNWTFTFFVTKFYVQLSEEIGTDKTFWMFSAICGLGVIFIYFVVPETKSKTLEQIQIELAGNKVTDSLTEYKFDSHIAQHNGIEIRTHCHR